MQKDILDEIVDVSAGQPCEQHGVDRPREPAVQLAVRLAVTALRSQYEPYVIARRRRCVHPGG